MRNLLLSWMTKQMPTDMLVQGLLKRLQSQYRMVPLSHGTVTLQDSCVAETAAMEQATAAFKVALDSLKFATEDLLRCKANSGSIVTTSDAMAPIELMNELLTYSQTNLQG